MSADNIKIIQEFFDAYNAQDLGPWDDLIDWEMPFHFNGIQLAGRDPILAVNAAAFASSSDQHADAHMFVVDGEHIAFRVRYTGTQDGPGWDGSPASGKAFEFFGNYIARIVNGKISGWWAVVDVATWQAQTVAD